MTDPLDAHSPTTEGTSTVVTFHSRVKTRSGDRDVQTTRVVPGEAESLRALVDSTGEFRHLQQMNVILTNACNLSCTYCYEQHRKDYGRFDRYSLKKLYDFFVGCNDVKAKLFTFFGGEPMAQKDLILEFFDVYKDDLQSNFPNVATSMVTNGLLLTPEFIDRYFSYPWVKLVVSLDTDREDLDHRELTQVQIDEILSNLASIPQEFKDTKSVCIRCTISRETAPHLREFVTRLHGLGIRSFVIHPLTMSLQSGFIEWNELEWVGLLTDMSELTRLPGILIQFSEGIGIREHSNCMVGSDMIAVDASGDYSGCYFFTNRKEEMGNAVLGNLLHGEVFVDRYKDFSSQYSKLFESEECRTCDLNNLCYQCPAGNLVTTGKMFRPDGMCKRVVTLFNLLQETITKHSFFAKLGRIRDSVEFEGPKVIARSLLHLLHSYHTGDKLDSKRIPDELPDYRSILEVFHEDPLLYYGTEIVLTRANRRSPKEEYTLKRLYEYLVSASNKPVFASQALTTSTLDTEMFYLTLIHFFVLNTKGKKLESAAEAMTVYEG